MFLKLRLQAKSVGLFHRKTGLVCHSIVCAVLWGGGLQTLCLSNYYIPMKFRNAAHLTAGARHSKGDPCVDCICPLTSAKQLESVGVRPCSLASAKQWNSVLTTGPMLVLKEGATSELSHLQNGVCQCLHLWGEFQISPDPLAGTIR